MEMPRYRPNTDKGLTHITFMVNGVQNTEYIPLPTSRLGYFVREKYRSLLDTFGIPHYYIHYRHFYPGPIRKMEDLRFLMHVVADHNEQPEDPHELRHYKQILSLYEPEFSFLVRPVIGKDLSKAGIEDRYVRAYYRNWLTKQTSPELRRLYHGVHRYEMIELLLRIQKHSDINRDRLVNRIKYHRKRAKS